MTNLTQAKKAKIEIEGICLEKDIVAKLEELGGKKEIDNDYDTIDWTFSDSSIVRFTTDEIFITI